MYWFTGALESFLDRITIDDRLCLVPDTRHIKEGLLRHLVPTPSIISAPPTPLFLKVPIDKNTPDSAIPSADTETQSKPDNIWMVKPQPMPSELAHEANLALPTMVSVASDLVDQVATPSFNMIPAPPQRSQKTDVLTRSSSAPNPMKLPPPLVPVPCARSRTPMLGIGGGGPTTQAQSCSKTLI